MAILAAPCTQRPGTAVEPADLFLVLGQALGRWGEGSLKGETLWQRGNGKAHESAVSVTSRTRCRMPIPRRIMDEWRESEVGRTVAQKSITSLPVQFAQRSPAWEGPLEDECDPQRRAAPEGLDGGFLRADVGALFARAVLARWSSTWESLWR